MAEINTNKKLETHPLFPSGEWEGFYTYHMGPGAEKHEMRFVLSFSDNQVTGLGGDDVGSFAWKGAYDTEKMECVMTKYYSTHTVFYKGDVDENGIWGTWKIRWTSGGFHIWPKKNKKGEEAKAEKAETQIIKR